MQELNLKVTGMQCAGCEKRLINTLNMLDGVDTVTANYHDGTVKIISNSELDIDAIKKILNDLDFPVVE